MKFPQKNKLYKIFFIIVLSISFFAIGSFNLDKNPALNQDEMGFSLGTKNISQTGHDLCGSNFPLFPCALNVFPYRSTTVSYYTSALLYKFYMPGAIFDIRIFSVLFGALTGIIFLLFLNKLFKNEKKGFTYAAILIIIFYFSPGVFTMLRFGAPYFILSLLLQIILFFLIYEFYRTKNRILLLFIPLTAALLMLEYQLYRFFAPFYLLLFMIIFNHDIFIKPNSSGIKLNMQDKIKFILSKNKYIAIGSSIFIFLFLIIIKQILSDDFTTQYYFTDDNFSLLKLLKDYLFHFSSIPFYFFYNLNFFFFLNNYGLFPSFSIIILIFGLLWILKNYRQNAFLKFILISFVLYPLPSALLGTERFVSNRIMNVIPIYFVILAAGIFEFQRIIENHTNRLALYKNISAAFILSFVVLFLIVFQNFYFIYNYFYIMPYKLNSCQFNTEHGRNCNFAELFYFLKNTSSDYNKIYLDDDLLFIDSYSQFFNQIMNYKINNYMVQHIENLNDFEAGSLIVTSEIKAKKLNFEKKYKLIKKINEPNRQDSFFYIFLSNN